MDAYKIFSCGNGQHFWFLLRSGSSQIDVHDLENGNFLGTLDTNNWDVAAKEVEKWPTYPSNGALHASELGYGEFYPRVYRFSGNAGDYSSFFLEHHKHERTTAHRAALLLFERMSELLEVIEPVDANSNAFGHANRQLLILACTEVEAAWRGVLDANSYPLNRWNTGDYVKLLKPMRLSEWEVKLMHSNCWPNMRPFGKWSEKSPTQSLQWYHAYNLVKHDREDQLKEASLKNVIDAMAALTIMSWACFGESVICKESVPFAALFEPTQRPVWHATEMYYGPRLKNAGGSQGRSWSPVCLPL